MTKYIKTLDDGYSYINVNFIVKIEYTPIEYRMKEYKDDPTIIKMVDGCYYHISNEDAEMLLKEVYIQWLKENNKL